MKYIYLLFLALFLASCEDKYVTEQYITEEYTTIEYGLNSISFEVDVLLEDWALIDGFDNIWARSVDAPEVDVNVEKTGFVLFFLINGSTYSPLPYTFPELDQGITFQTQLMASYEGGFVNFEFLDLHPSNPLPPPRNYKVRTVVVYADDDNLARSIDLNNFETVASTFKLGTSSNLAQVN